MMTLIIWWGGILLEFLVLFRGFRAKIVSKYAFFYVYIASLLLADTSLYFVYVMSRSSYEKWNWATGFLNLVLGCGILLEIFKHVLSPYAGAERFARIAGLAAFAAIFCFAILHPGLSDAAKLGARNAGLEKDFLTVQAILLFGILGVVSYYGIAMGKNLKGMVCGYGLCLATSLMTLALRAYLGPVFNSAWAFIQPFVYMVSLLVWVVMLWSYHPDPFPEAGIRLEEDYEAFAERTRDMVGAMRTQFVKAARS
jgi:hypothetical protein